MSKPVKRAKVTPVKRAKVTPGQYGKELGVSTDKVIRWIRTGELPAINVASDLNNRPRFLIDVEDIAKFEKARAVIPDGGLSTTQRLRRQASTGVREFF